MQRSSPARFIALVILLIFMGAICIGTNLLTAGRSDMALRIFGGAILVSLTIFFIGGLIVAATKPPEQP